LRRRVGPYRNSTAASVSNLFLQGSD
jgi:hypothetical protein